MKRHHAVATWDGDGWEIDFPAGIREPGWAGTCTGSGKDTKKDAEFMARDLVACHFDYEIRREDVKLTIEWKNERQYQKWHERRFGMRDCSR